MMGGVSYYAEQSIVSILS